MATISTITAQAVVGSGATYADVDAAIDAGEVSIYVLAGTTGLAGWTQDQADVEVELGPGCTVTSGTISITGANNSLIIGPNCQVQVEIDNTTGADVYLKGQGCFTGDLVDINGANGYIMLGGWGSEVESIDIAGDDAVVEFSRADSKNPPHGSAAGLRAFVTGANRTNFRCCKATNSDSRGFEIGASDFDGLVLGCTMLLSDAEGIYDIATADKWTRIEGTYVEDGPSIGIRPDGDRGIVCGCIVDQHTTNSINITVGGANDIIVTGCRLDDAVVDSGTNNTIGLNEVGSFT
jgi:hypothetical protein